MIRIIWRYNRQEVPFDDLLGDPAPAVERLDLERPDWVSPVFSDDREYLREESYSLPGRVREDPENDLTHYFQAFVEDDSAAGPIFARLERARQNNQLDWFDAQINIQPSRLPQPTGGRIHIGPDPGDATPAWDAGQVYLGPPDPSGRSPSGVEARFAWGIKGGRGQNVKIVDVEGEWLLDHEDLKGQVCCQFGSFGGDAEAEAHGTAVLGILCANPQDPPLQRLGVIGIAHRARVGVASYKANGRPPDPEDMVKRASRWLEAGDVILLELQAARPDRRTGLSGPALPMEAWAHGRAAIEHAAGKGIYVIEAAADGGVVLNPANHGVPDTGRAFMVGAGDIVNGSALRPITNRGPRVDLQGWGDEVVTTGTTITKYSDLQARTDPRRCYTRSFNATSSAAAIVAGCVAVISSVVRAHGHPALTPEDMKALLIQTGTFPDRTGNGGIGPLPNIQAALKELERRLGAPFVRV